MNQPPPPEIIWEIAAVHFLQKETSHKVGNVLWAAEKDKWSYQVIGKWMQTTTFLLTLWEKKFALKLSNNEKMKWDTEIELWLREKQWQNNPQIFSTGEGQLPGISGKYLWNIQEYIPWTLWKESEINDAQLDSFLSQLDSLHSIHQSETSGWGWLVNNKNGQEEGFWNYINIFKGKIDKCDFFSHNRRRERVMEKIEHLQTRVWDMSHYKPVLIHNDAHTSNVILDGPASVRLIDYGNPKWSCPEEELAVIQTHCIGSRMWLFKRILDWYRSKRPFDDDLFQLFALLNACSKINTRKEEVKRLLVWNQLVEPLLVSL